MIPLLHDFADETVLVFGGGRVGARKARRFDREASVVVVSPEFVGVSRDADADTTESRDPDSDHSDFGDTDSGDADTDHADSGDADFRRPDFGDADLVRAAPGAADVTDWFDRVDPALVVAATDDDEFNAAVERHALDRNVLVNRADEHGGRDAGSVVVPATVRDGPVTVAVATGGTSPALSRYLRRRIEDDLAGAGEMATLTGALREELRADGVPPAERRAALRRVVRSGDVWKALDSRDANPRDVAVDVLDDEAGDQA